MREQGSVGRQRTNNNKKCQKKTNITNLKNV